MAKPAPPMSPRRRRRSHPRTPAASAKSPTIIRVSALIGTTTSAGACSGSGYRERSRIATGSSHRIIKQARTFISSDSAAAPTRPGACWDFRQTRLVDVTTVLSATTFSTIAIGDRPMPQMRHNDPCAVAGTLPPDIASRIVWLQSCLISPRKPARISDFESSTSR
jgi:hypothetical protein